MALPLCVRAILCGLSTGVQNALAGILAGYIAIIDVEIGALTGYLVYLNIATLPINALNSVVQTALLQAKAAANIVPFSIIGECIQVGDLNVAIQANIDVILEDVNVIATDLSRLLSIKEETDAAIRELQAVRDTYVEVLGILNACAALGLTA